MRIGIALGAALVLGLVVWFRPARPAGVTTAGWEPARAPAARAASRAPAAQAVVYVAGQVVRPGVYTVGADARAAAAIARAGGMRSDADTTAVNLAARVHDGDEILVPAQGAPGPPRSPRRRTTGPRRRSHGRRGHAPARRPDALVDLNRADAATLATIPGIGAGLAERIVAFRSANGPFGSADELLDVSGITDRRLEALLPYVVAR
jgi:competence protein ComEA